MLRFDACEVFSFPLSGKTNCCCTFLVQQRLTGEQTGRSGLAAFLRLSLPRTPLLPSWKFLDLRPSLILSSRIIYSSPFLFPPRLPGLRW